MKKRFDASLFLYIIIFILCFSFLGYKVYRNYFSLLSINTNNIPVNILLKNKVVDVGIVEKDKPVVAIFKVKNNDKNKWFIDTVEADCHCTVAFINKKIINPNDSLYLKIQYKNENTGYFQRVMALKSNATENPIFFLIRGKTISSLK